ncbi:hypothetical protein DRJ19_05300 [Candidatus Woesearchaeota archaeon]|nr:MAG: hypothetical protein DRJ19_05300 [Candidatus Woesearchaeota archaeon]
MNEAVNEYLMKAKQEMKRVDHIYWVSLKYTRTVDVIRNAIERMLNVLFFAVDCFLAYAMKQGKIENIPATPIQKAELAKRILSEADKSELADGIDFYLFLRKLLKAPFSREDEYRKTVRMIVDLEGKYVSVDLEELANYYAKVKAFLSAIEDIVKCEEVL